MKYFNRLCRIVEENPKFTGKLKEVLNDCRLFYVSDSIETEKAFDALFEPADEYGFATAIDEFFLPYKTTALCTETQCTILKDFYPDQRGENDPRFFITATDMVVANHPDVTDDHRAVMNSLHNQKFLTVGIGLYANHEFYGKHPDFKNLEDSLQFANDREREAYLNTTRDVPLISLTICVVNRKKLYSVSTMKNKFGLAADAPAVRDQISFAINAITYLNQPNMFILETTPTKFKNKKYNGKRIPRANQRPVYTLLKPGEIRRRMGVAEPVSTHKSPVPHERRRHTRYYSHPRYGVGRMARVIPSGPRKGQTYFQKQIIPATWIGPSSGQDDKHYYRVILDR